MIQTVIDEATVNPSEAIRQRRYFACSTAAFAVMLAGIGSAMTVTAMGGIPERGVGGSLVLNNHGVVSPAGDAGWLIAKALHFASISSLVVVFVLAAGCLLCFRGKAGSFRTVNQKRIAVGVVLGGLAAVMCWALVLGLTGLGAWLARLH